MYLWESEVIWKVISKAPTFFQVDSVWPDSDSSMFFLSSSDVFSKF